MIAKLLLGFVVLMAGIVVALVAAYVPGRSAWWIAAGLSVWFGYVGLLGYFGVIQNATMRPPGVVLILIPILVFSAYFIVMVFRSDAGARLALAFPLWILLGLQAFRVVVELFLHQLWRAGIVPRMLTFSGANVDIYIGASAALIAWVSVRGRRGIKIALAWNGLGLLTLANVVVRSVLTTPGPLHRLHAEVPNRLLGAFPFLFIPGFCVPLALVLHLLALRAIISRLHAPTGSRSIPCSERSCGA